MRHPTGDRCSTEEDRSPKRCTEQRAFAQTLVQRCQTNWRLPPPNILLSDLGIRELGRVWSNIDGIRSAEPNDYADSFAAAAAASKDERSMARRLLQRHVTEPYVVRRRRKRKREVGENSDTAVAAADDKLLDFGRLYPAFVTDDETTTGSAKNRAFWNNLGLIVTDMATMMAMNAIAIRLTRSAVNRALRYIGRDMAGHITRAFSLGFRATSVHMVSAVFARFSTRIIVALGMTASGISTVIGLVELLAAVLDFMILFGWGPGNYNAHFDNAVYDDLAVGWLRHNCYFCVAPIDPYLVLTIFNRNQEGAVTPHDGADAVDLPPSRSNSAGCNRMIIRARDQIPWYFASFDQATDAIIADEGSGAAPASYRQVELARLKPCAKIRLSVAGRKAPAADPLTNDPH